MAIEKIQLTNFGNIPTSEINYLQINDGVCEVKQTIPFEQILKLIQWVINLTIDDRPFISEPIKKIVQDCALLKYYTNIDLTFIDSGDFEATKLYEAYDLIFAHDIMEKVKPLINPMQLEFISSTIDKTLKSIVDYRNSAQGIIDVLSLKANSQVESMEKAIQEFEDPSKMQEVHKIMKLVEDLNLAK